MKATTLITMHSRVRTTYWFDMANTALHCNEMPPQQDTTAITARNNENSKNNARFVLSHD